MAAGRSSSRGSWSERLLHVIVCTSLVLAMAGGAISLASPSVLANATVPLGGYSYVITEGTGITPLTMTISSYDAGTGDLSGTVPDDYYVGTVTGSVSGSDVSLSETGGGDPGWTKTLTGTVDSFGVMTGTWTDGDGYYGNWYALPDTLTASDIEGVYNDVGTVGGNSYPSTVFITSFDSGTGDFSGIGTAGDDEISGTLSGSEITSLTETYENGSEYVSWETGGVAPDGVWAGAFTDTDDQEGTWAWYPEENSPNPSANLGGGHAIRHDDQCESGPGTVDCATGDMNDSFTDIKIPGPGGGLTVTRTYNSLSASTGTLFGDGWSCNLCISLTQNDDGTVTITEGDGSQAIAFPNNDGGYLFEPMYDSTLSYSDDTWTFVQQQGDTYTFNSDGQLTSVTDLNGYTTTLAYTDGDLSSVTNADGQSLSISENDDGEITSVEDPLDQTTDYAYDDAGNLTSVTNSDSDEWQYGYDDSHLMTSMTDPDGNELTTTFDDDDRVTSQTQANDAETTYSYSGNPYSASGGTTIITDPNENEELEDYTNGELTSLTKGYDTDDAETWTYTYDPNTLAMTSETDPNGNTTTFTDDSNGNMLTETDPLSDTTTYTYNDFNEPLTIEDPDGNYTTNTYDADGNLCWTDVTSSAIDGPSCDSPPSGATAYTYGDDDLPGYPTAVADPDDNSTDMTYNDEGDLLSSTNAAGDETSYTYDADGRMLTEVSPEGNVEGHTAADYTTTYTYNALNEPLTVTDPLGNETVNTYDSDGNLLTTTDPESDTTVNTYNDVNELTEVQQKTSGGTVVQTTYTGYDADGNVTSQTDGNGNETTYAYDGLNQQTSMTTPGDEETTYTYDGDGNLLTTTEPDGDVATNTYNDGDQLTGTSYSDDSTPSVSYTYDDDGNMLTMTDGTGTSTWTYNDHGDETSYENGNGLTVSYGYDAAGNETSITYPGDHEVTQGYNDANEMTSITDWNSEESTFSYDADGNLTAENLPNGVTNSYSYDDADNLTSIDVKNGDDDSVFAADYTRNSDSLVSEDSSQSDSSDEYQYTALNQVCYAGSTNSDACSSPPGGATTYGYDEAGNLTGDNGTTQSFNTSNELCWSYSGSSDNSCDDAPSGATSYTYNDNGDRTATTPSSGSASAYSYNGANELTQYQLGDDTATTYAYDGNGLLQSQSTGDSTSQFTWDDSGSLPLLLQQTTGDDTTNYVYGPTGSPLEEILPDSDTYWYSQDDLGSTRALTDSSGDVADTDTYDPYGNITSATGSVANSLLYGGEYLDTESGLYYLLARWYDPTTAQFQTVDPLVEQTQSPYAYTLGDPVNDSDPTGEFSPGQYNGPISNILGGSSSICENGTEEDPDGGEVACVASGLIDGGTIIAWGILEVAGGLSSLIPTDGQHGNNNHKHTDYQSWTNEQVLTALKNNPGNRSLIQEAKGRGIYGCSKNRQRGDLR